MRASSENVHAEQFGELESEAMITLKAMRGQLQNMTERLFRQERETHQLHKSIVESRWRQLGPGSQGSREIGMIPK